MEKEAKIYIAGGQSLIGAALLGELESRGYGNLLGKYTEGLDLTDPSQVDAYFATTKPEYVFLAAGQSGGIEANQKYPADLMRDNLLTGCHILHSAFQHRVKKLLYLASSCSYPKLCPQPMKEEYLLTGLLEPTNEAYALAEPGRQYAVYFTGYGDRSVGLDLSAVTRPLALSWLDIGSSAWQPAARVRGGGTQELSAPGEGQWAVLLSGGG